MKKGIKIGIAVTFLLGVLLCIVFGIDFYMKRMQSADIIGGADSPTAVFVAGSFLKSLISPAVIVFILLIVAVVVYIVKKKRRF